MNTNIVQIIQAPGFEKESGLNQTYVFKFFNFSLGCLYKTTHSSTVESLATFPGFKRVQASPGVGAHRAGSRAAEGGQKVFGSRRLTPAVSCLQGSRNSSRSSSPSVWKNYFSPDDPIGDHRRPRRSRHHRSSQTPSSPV